MENENGKWKNRSNLRLDRQRCRTCNNPAGYSRRLRTYSTAGRLRPGHSDGHANDPHNYANVTFHDAGGTKYLIDDTLVMPRVNTFDRQIDLPIMQKEWPYLAGLAIPNVRPEEVAVIIGADFKRAHDVLEIRQGRKQSDPQAELRRFGWVLFGKVSNRYMLNVSKRQRHVNVVNRIDPDEMLKRGLEQLWTTESFGIKPGVRLPITL